MALAGPTVKRALKAALQQCGDINLNANARHPEGIPKNVIGNNQLCEFWKPKVDVPKCCPGRPLPAVGLQKAEPNKRSHCSEAVPS